MAIKIRWNLQRDLPLFAPRYNVAPSQEVPVIVRNEDRNEEGDALGFWFRRGRQTV